MKRIFSLITAFILLSAGGSIAAENGQAYLSVLPDIPIMEGMREDAGQQVMFDKEAGRIVETAIIGPQTDENSAVTFYQQVLTQLGWNQGKPGVFTRNGEQLIVKSGKVEGGVRVTFALVPKPD